MASRIQILRLQASLATSVLRSAIPRPLQPLSQSRRAQSNSRPDGRLDNHPKSRFSLSPEGEEAAQHGAEQESKLPRILQSSIWMQMIPKALRNRLFQPSSDTASMAATSAAKPSKSWFRAFWDNPAALLIILPLLVGSQAIQLIALRADQNDFDRRVDTRLLVLREVLQRINSGEWVIAGPDGELQPGQGKPDQSGILTQNDAEREIRKLLGTGVEEEELEWLGIINEAKQAINAEKPQSKETAAEQDEPAKGDEPGESPVPGSSQPVSSGSSTKVAFY